MELAPFTFGFYSGESPVRGLIASATLDGIVKDRYGGRVPVRGLVLVDRVGADVDLVVSRTLEALSKGGVDVPPARVVELGRQEADAYVYFTRYEGDELPRGAPSYFLGDLAGAPGSEVEDTLGDVAQLIPIIRDLVERALPSMLLMARHRHIGAVVEALAGIVERYRRARVDVLSDFPSSAASLGELEDALFELAAPEGPLRRYSEAYGSVCLCGGTMQVVGERYRNGVYEVTFACDRCGRRVIRRH